MTSTQFLGAFNDNLFKQLALLLALGGVAGAAANGANGKSQDVQSVAMAVFALPFLLFSGFAGFVSEKNSKRTVIIACKVAEILIVLLGMVAFLLWDVSGMAGMLVVLFLMGAHSAFFGPGKYGILPELFGPRDLPQANGIILMTTFLAIIFGTALAGWLKDVLGEPRLWIASLVCLLIAAAGTQTALLIRRIPAADPKLQFRVSSLLVPGEVWRMLRSDTPLLKVLLASCLFWLIGGIVQPSVNALGRWQFLVEDTWTSILAASMGIGIAFGCLLAGKLSQGRANFGLMRIGAWLIVVTLGLIAVPGPGGSNLLRYEGTLVVLVVLGVGAGFFAVPLQVFLQSRPPDSLKGRTIATMNLANWVAIIISAGVYALFETIISKFGLPHATTFAFTALLMLPVAMYYRPEANDGSTVSILAEAEIEARPPSVAGK